MIDIPTVSNCLAGLVGFRNSDRTCISDFSDSQTGSTSTVYVTDEPAITPTNILAAMPKDYSSLGDYVSNIIRKSSQEMIQEFIYRHKELTRARTIIDNIKPVKGNAILTNQITKAGRFVGIIIEPSKSYSLAAVIRSIGVQLNSLNPGLTLYLYETSQNDATATLTLTGHNKILSLQWFDSTMIAKYQSPDGGTGQRFLLGYYEDDLIGNAVSTNIANCNSGCYGYEWVQQYQKHVYITGFSIPPSGLNGINLPNTQMISEGSESYGLHIHFYVTCDISQIICDNKNIFALAASKRTAMRFYRDYANNSNLSREADMTRDRALTNYEMAKEEYDGLLKSVRIDFTDIDRYCLPCSQKELQTTILR
jgi:hypothetical protein